MSFTDQSLSSLIRQWSQLERLISPWLFEYNWIVISLLAVLCLLLSIMIVHKFFLMHRFSRMKQKMFQELIQQYDRRKTSSRRSNIQFQQN